MYSRTGVFIYLNLKELVAGPVSSHDEYVERLQMHPFLKHAAIAWPYYVRSATLSPKLQGTVLRFLDSQPPNMAFMSWVQVLNATTQRSGTLIPSMLPLCIMPRPSECLTLFPAWLRPTHLSMLQTADLEVQRYTQP
jgi:hypothetical protein